MPLAAMVIAVILHLSFMDRAVYLYFFIPKMLHEAIESFHHESLGAELKLNMLISAAA